MLEFVNEFIVLSDVGGPRRSQLVGTWKAGKGLEVPQPQMFERRKDLSGVTIINTLLPWNPICIMHEHENGTLYDASGLFLGIYKLLEEVSSGLTPTTTIIYFLCDHFRL